MINVVGNIELEEHLYFNDAADGDVFIFVNMPEVIFMAHCDGAVVIALTRENQNIAVGDVVYGDDEYINIPIKKLNCDLVIK